MDIRNQETANIPPIRKILACIQIIYGIIYTDREKMDNLEAIIGRMKNLVYTMNQVIKLLISIILIRDRYENYIDIVLPR